MHVSRRLTITLMLCGPLLCSSCAPEDRATNSDATNGDAGKSSNTASHAKYSSAQTHPDVLLITIDTLRADHLGCYGSSAAATPHIDTLADHGLRYAQAVTTAPHTLTAHSSIMTGKYPPSHGVRDNGTFKLPDAQITLAERLRDAGYVTGGFVGAFVLDQRYGIAQGFETYDDDLTSGASDDSASVASLHTTPERRGDHVVDAALAWWQSKKESGEDRPRFAWVHLYDPHAPYAAPEPFRSNYRNDSYSGEVAFADAQVGRIIDVLKSVRALDDTLMILVGDHGESLGEHGEATHGLLLYEATVHVPLILHWPARWSRAEVIEDRVVSTVDIFPTVLTALGLDAEDCDGRDLLKDDASVERAVYLETLTPQLKHGWSPLFALRDRTSKFIEAPTPEYYDLDRDPHELNNLADSPAATQMQGRLTELRTTLESEGAVEAQIAPDADAIEKLAALGYVGADVKSAPANPIDPKVAMAQWDRDGAALLAAFDAGKFDTALEISQRILDVMPHNGDVWTLRAAAQEQLGQNAEAIKSCVKAIELQPHNVENWLRLARLQFATGDAKAGEASLHEAIEREPDHGEIYLIKARQALQSGKFDDARKFCAEAREHDPIRSTVNAWLLEAEVLTAMGDDAQATAAYQRVLDCDRHNLPARLGLTALLERKGEYTQAIAVLEPLVESGTANAGVNITLANLRLRAGRIDEAIATLQQVLRDDPKQVSALQNLGAAYASKGDFPQAITQFRRVLEIDPAQADASRNLARALGKVKEYGQAANVLTEALNRDDRNVELLGDLAWMRATAPDATVRNGQAAIQIAERATAIAGKPVLRVGDALAAGYAEIGKFNEAVAVAQQVEQFARSSGQEAYAQEVAARRARYASGKPYHQAE